MKKYLVLLAYLFSNIVMQAMDENLLDSDSFSDGYMSCEEGCESNLPRNTNIDCILPAHIPYMVTLHNMLGDLKANLQEMDFSEDVERYIGNESFPQLMALLSECIIINDSMPASELTEGNKEQILKHVLSKSYSPKQMVSMLRAVNFLEIAFLPDPLLVAVVPRIVDLFKENKHSLAMELLDLIPVEMHNKFRKLFLQQYPADVWCSLGEKIPVLVLAGTKDDVTITKNSKYIIQETSQGQPKILNPDGTALHTIACTSTAHNSQIIIGLTSVGVEIWEISTGRLIETITTASLNEIISNNNAGLLARIYLDEQFIAFMLPEHIVIFKLDNLKQPLKILNFEGAVNMHISSEQNKLIINTLSSIYSFDINTLQNSNATQRNFSQITYTSKYILIRSIAEVKIQITTHDLDPVGEALCLINDIKALPNELFTCYAVKSHLWGKNDVLQYRVWNLISGKQGIFSGSLELPNCLLGEEHVIMLNPDLKKRFVCGIADGSTRLLAPHLNVYNADKNIVSGDKKFIVFKDTGNNSLLNIWPYLEGHTLYEILSEVYPPATERSCTIS